MSEELVTVSYPLAYDQAGDPIRCDGICYWRVKRLTGGCPALVRIKGTSHPVLLDASANMDEFGEAVGWQPGPYILEPLDEEENILGGRVAYVFLSPRNAGGQGSSDGRLYDLVDRLVEQQQSNTVVLGDMLRTLTGSIVEMQRGSTNLLNAANTTIQVANGVEALEREPAPYVDTEDLAERLTDSFKAASKGDAKSPWTQLIPVGLQFLQGLTKPIIERQLAEAAAAKAEAEKRAQTPNEEE